MRFRAGLLTISLALGACAPAVKPPAVVKVPVATYVAVPAALTTPCPVAMPTGRTVAEAVRVARSRRAALEQCNRQLEAIRKLGER